jgi:four helix bundle protein
VARVYAFERVAMTYEEWKAQVSEVIKKDNVWRVKAYQLSLFLFDLAWQDVSVLLRNRRTHDIADQLCRATARISASVIEGYSRDTGKARSTFYEYALGSVRESRDWYYKGRHALSSDVVRHRMELCTEIAKLTLTMIANERRTNRRPGRS